MNTTSIPITLILTGQISLDAKMLEQLIRLFQIQPAEKSPTPPSPATTKLVYNVTETAEILGLSEKSIYRLIERRLLRSAGGLRHKRITHTEIERFLKMTTG